MLQETWDVRDIAFAAGANLSDLVDCLVNAPKGQGETVRAALMSVLPASVRASPPALTARGAQAAKGHISLGGRRGPGV
eukprot:g20754.t1